MKRILAYTFLALNLALVTYVWYQSASSLFDASFQASLLAIGRLAGLLGTVLLLLQYVLISRAQWIERLFGFDRLTRMHRTNGLLAFVLISSHIPMVTVGTAGLNGVSVPEQYRTFLFTYDYIWLAAIAYGILVMTIVLSIAMAKRLIDYQKWYYLHLLNYSIAFLALFHQVNTGSTLNGGTWFTGYWYALFIIVFSNLIAARFISPVYAYYKYRFKVERVEPEASGTNSIYVTGKNLENFAYEAGQFAKWRFMGRGFWKEEHPFTISSEPNGRYLRLTPKAVGDYTSRLDQLKIGTPVIVSGPFGKLTLKASNKQKLLFIAGGIGITPLRAMLARVSSGQDAILLYSAKQKSDIAFKEELDELAEKSNVKAKYLLSENKMTGFVHGRLDAEILQKYVPDVNIRDIYLVGPPTMMNAIEKLLIDQGVTKKHIYTERFSFAN